MDDAINAGCAHGHPGDCGDRAPCTNDNYCGHFNVPVPELRAESTCDFFAGCPFLFNKTAPGICAGERTRYGQR